MNLKYCSASFMINVHDINHCMNLVIQILFQLGIVEKIEDVLKSLYAHFFQIPKRIKNLIELVNIIETRGQRIFRNIKT
jgi:hypothetical protein